MIVSMKEHYLSEEKLIEIHAEYKRLNCKGLGYVDRYGDYEHISKRWNAYQLRSLFINWNSVRLFRNMNKKLVIENEQY